MCGGGGGGGGEYCSSEINIEFLSGGGGGGGGGDPRGEVGTAKGADTSLPELGGVNFEDILL